MGRRRLEEPNMSDNLLLVKVEDLINMAMGADDKNVVNFKMVQMVLHILARHLRLLETEVEIRISEEQEKAEKEKIRRQRDGSVDSGREGRHARGRMKGIDEHDERLSKKEREKLEKQKLKEERAASKEKEKEERVASKERGKEERAASKEREKEERAASKERTKAEKQSAKEKGKAEKAAAKDREKAEKAEQKEKEKEEKIERKEKDKAEKMERKDQDKSDKEVAKAEGEKDKLEKGGSKAGKEKGKGRSGSGTSIVVSEKKGGKDKVLVVEKGPTTRHDSRTRVGSIEVVTLSQFEMLESAVNKLQAITGPLPTPEFPDNKKLMEDIANGTASLTDIMQAMQVTARIKAAEQAIGRMADLLTQLAAAGAIPEELVEMVEEVKAEVDEVAAATGEKSEDGEALPKRSHVSAAARKSVAIDPLSGPSSIFREPGRPPLTSTGADVKSVASTSSGGSKMVPMPPVTHNEMDHALRALRDELHKAMTFMTSKATNVAENASMTARGVAEKLEVALRLNSRISTLNSLVNDYAEQLSGFDTGLTSQMQGFQEQMAQMRNDLKSGMVQLSQVGGASETTAMMELTERYDLLVVELDGVVHEHQGLASLQKQLGDELRTLVECVEMLREQKADRDEVLDGLRDKADISRLAGLLTEKTFGAIREELERRLEMCHDKFRRQESVWMSAIKELSEMVEGKAQLMQLLATRDEAQRELRCLHHKLHKLADILGEPKAAILTRHLARDATCGVCMVPALMEPWDASFGAPPPLPALRPAPAGAPAEDPMERCLRDIVPPPPPDSKAHACHRWVGGSHTLVTDAVSRQKAPPATVSDAPVKRYPGYGTDGRLYMLEEEMQPCVECNVIMEPKSPAEKKPEVQNGAGDQGHDIGTDKK